MGFKIDIALTPDELEAYLTGTAHDPDRHDRARAGSHNVPYYFAWHDGRVFFNTTLGNLAVKEHQHPTAGRPAPSTTATTTRSSAG